MSITGESAVTSGPQITCPLCRHVHRDYADYPQKLKWDGDVAVMACHHCSADIRVELAVTYEYTAVPA